MQGREYGGQKYKKDISSHRLIDWMREKVRRVWWAGLNSREFHLQHIMISKSLLSEFTITWYINNKTFLGFLPLSSFLCRSSEVRQVSWLRLSGILPTKWRQKENFLNVLYRLKRLVSTAEETQKLLALSKQDLEGRILRWYAFAPTNLTAKLISAKIETFEASQLA